MWLFAGVASSQIAASAFTWGTVAVLPCYTFMVIAPQAELVKTSSFSFFVREQVHMIHFIMIKK